MKAVQSAMAIRRQRRRRDEALRAKMRRASHQSDNLMLSDSGDAGSMLSLEGVHSNGVRSIHRHRQMMGGITTFHVGIVFFIMGLMLLISGIVPGYANRQHQYWEEPQKSGAANSWNKEGNRNAPLLLVTGSFLILMGIALVVANRIATRREDELFSRYISRKLAPARITHQPASSLHHLTNQHSKSANGHHDQSDHEELRRVVTEGSTGQQEPQCQSPGQLESITEESEGGDKTSKDQIFWTSDLAPVHHHNHHHHHHHHHSTVAKLVHEDNHHVGSSTG